MNNKEVAGLLLLVGKMMELVKIHNKCSKSNCNKERNALLKDTTADSLYKTDIKLLNPIDRDRHIKDKVNNKLIFDLEKCNYNKCNKVAKEIFELALEITSKTPLNKDSKYNKLSKEFKELLKLQKLSDSEFNKLREIIMRITLT
jgi:hypothetical protein